MSGQAGARLTSVPQQYVPIRAAGPAGKRIGQHGVVIVIGFRTGGIEEEETFVVPDQLRQKGIDETRHGRFEKEARIIRGLEPDGPPSPHPSNQNPQACSSERVKHSGCEDTVA